MKKPTEDDASIVDPSAQGRPAPGVPGRFGKCRRRRDVSDQDLGRTLECLGGLASRLRVELDPDRPPAVGDESLEDRPADTGPATGDDDAPRVVAAHDLFTEAARRTSVPAPETGAGTTLVSLTR